LTGSRLLALATCLLLVLSVFGVAPARADTLPRHQDPQTLGPQLPDVSSLFDLYGFVFNLTASEDFSGAVGWLNMAKLVYTTPDAQYLIDRYNGQLGTYVSGLNVTKADIELAREYLRHLRMDDLDVQIKKILRDLNEANVTLKGIHLTSLDIGTLLKTSPDQLLAGEDNLKALAEEYAQQIEVIRQVIQDTRALNGTILSIEVAPGEVLVGSRVVVTGTLTDVVGKALETKSVDVLFDGEVVGNVVTDVSGVFNLGISVPFVYEDHLSVTAEYWPSGGDELVYIPSASNEVQVKLTYYTPLIDVTVPKIVYPGKAFPIAGNVTYGGVPVAGISVVVTVFGLSMVVTPGADGRFGVEVPVPGDSLEGSASIRLTSHANGVYAPATVAMDVGIVRLPLELRIEVPIWAVSGFPVKIQGTAVCEGAPVVNCSIRLDSGVGSVVTRTGENGGFEADLSPSMVQGTGNYPFTLKATPVEPWVGSSSVGFRVFMTNLLTLVGGSVLLVAGGFYASRNIRRRPRRLARRDEPVVEVPIPVAFAPVVDAEPVGMRDSYAFALDAVSRRTGMSPRPSFTLREYLSEVSGKLGEEGRPFRALTMLYERWLYDRAPDVNLGAVRGLLRRVSEFFSVEG
jgi:hypothetical protein